MADRLVVDLGGDGLVRVGTVINGELSSLGGPAELAWPLDGEALEDLRWYLEDYLTAPFGVYEDRGVRIEAELPGWGHSVFRAVFRSGPARDAYVKMRAQGDIELVFRSASPSLLGLPWELMTEPGRPAPLALDICGVSRSLSVPPDIIEAVPVPDGRLRVLMVISRPSGTKDTGYRMIARPLLRRLDAVRGPIELVVLRPPTLEALRAELSAACAAGAPYQVVHFDGHGAFFGLKTADGGEGVLVFERPEGGPHYVPARVISQVLAASGVPVVVLNACQSGAVGKMLEAAIATRLLAEGIASVVAMAYSVYAVAAAEFMVAFYEKLFAGGTVAAAVTSGRQQLFRKPGRPSPRGELPLADWMVPVHYFGREVSFPQAVVSRPAEFPPLADALTVLSAPASGTDGADLDAIDGVFVGRDALFYDLEAAARLQKVVILVGPGGTGKTELAKGFGRWWRDTGGVDNPDFVFWHSFEPGVALPGLDGVISEIGLRLYGADFALRHLAGRRADVVRALTTHRMLLIWDNFESVRSMSDSDRATPWLDERGCAELRDFATDLAAHGKTAVLITSRAQEDWLGDVRRVEVGGLAVHEAAEYADSLLASSPSARDRRRSRAFGDLMEWLGGHPLTMRLVLPLVRDSDPGTLLSALQGAIALPEEGDINLARMESLAASVAYSYTHLEEQTRRLLPAVSLLHSVADADVLSLFSAVPEVPGRFARATPEAWAAALDDAVRVGLLTSLGGTLYRIHPALPGYLAGLWRTEERESHDATRDESIRALIKAHAAWGTWLHNQVQSGNVGMAHMVIGLERHTMGSLLGYAVDHGLWSAVQDILQPLDGYWDACGQDAEAHAWADRARLAVEASDGAPPRPDSVAGALWLFVTGSRAGRELERGHLDDAESGYREIMGALQATDSWPEQQRYLATTYHNLGRIAESRGQLSEAEDWYLKSITIKETIGNQQGMAASYQEIGNIAYLGGRLDEAEHWYRRSLAIAEDVGDLARLAGAYHLLGVVAHDRGSLEEAEKWYGKSLAIGQARGNRSGIAISYSQLGDIAMDRGWPEVAEEWHRKALTIREMDNDQPGLGLDVPSHRHGSPVSRRPDDRRGVAPQIGESFGGDRRPARGGDVLLRTGRGHAGKRPGKRGRGLISQVPGRP